MIQAYKDECETRNDCWGVQIFESRFIGNQIGLCTNFDAAHTNLHPNSGFQGSRLFQRTVNGRKWNDAGWGDVALQITSTQNPDYEAWLVAKGLTTKPWTEGSTAMT